MLEDLSIGKILFILLVALIFFGPKKIPDIAQSIGKGIKEFRKAMRDVSDDIKNSSTEDETSQTRSRNSDPAEGETGRDRTSSTYQK